MSNTESLDLTRITARVLPGALTLYLIYRDYGDYATADRILGHLLVEGCVSYH
jgi:hypothetical protein